LKTAGLRSVVYIIYARRWTLLKVMHGRWSAEPCTGVSLCTSGQKLCCSINPTQSAVYMMNKNLWNLADNWSDYDLCMPWRTCCEQPWRVHWNHAKTGPCSPKDSSRCRHKILRTRHKTNLRGLKQQHLHYLLNHEDQTRHEELQFLLNVRAKTRSKRWQKMWQL